MIFCLLPPKLTKKHKAHIIKQSQNETTHNKCRFYLLHKYNTKVQYIAKAVVFTWPEAMPTLCSLYLQLKVSS